MNRRMSASICLEDGSFACRLTKYQERGRLKAKLYIPRDLVKKLRIRKGRPIKLLFRGRIYECSFVWMRNGRSKKVYSGKIYLPIEVFDKLEKDVLLVRPVSKDLLVVEGEAYVCSICGKLTNSPDRMCFGRHYELDGFCMRCGRPLKKGEKILCGGCLKAFMISCGLEGLMLGEDFEEDRESWADENWELMGSFPQTLENLARV